MHFGADKAKDECGSDPDQFTPLPSAVFKSGSVQIVVFFVSLRIEEAGSN